MSNMTASDMAVMAPTVISLVVAVIAAVENRLNRDAVFATTSTTKFKVF